jgi:hypothetical protein
MNLVRASSRISKILRNKNMIVCVDRVLRRFMLQFHTA